MWGPSVTTRGHIWCFCRVNSTRYIAQVVKPVLLPFLRQEDVLFQQDSAGPHTVAATQRVLRDVQSAKWIADHCKQKIAILPISSMNLTCVGLLN